LAIKAPDEIPDMLILPGSTEKELSFS